MQKHFSVFRPLFKNALHTFIQSLGKTPRTCLLYTSSSTGAYWRGDASKQQLCRIYGITFPKASELEAYLTMLEEAKKRDHRKLGKELELFTIMDEGPGFPLFLPKGMVLKNRLIDYWRQIHREAGYQEISTPMILSLSLIHILLYSV